MPPVLTIGAVRGPARRHALGLVALCALALAACGGPTSEPVGGSGFRGAALTGLRLYLDGSTAGQSAVFELGNGADVDAELEVITELGARSCVEDAADLPCPEAQDAAIEFVVAATLDFARDLDLRPDVGGEPAGAVRQQGPQRQERRFSLGLPDLAPGRHCVVVTMTEDAEPVVAGQLPDHSSAATWWVTVGTSAVDHCTVGATTVEPRASTSLAACGSPVLSVVPDGGRLHRSVAEDREVFAAVPVCSPPAVGLLLHEGRPQLGGDVPGPLAVPQWTDGGAPVFPLGTLPAGAWHLVAVQLGDGGTPSSASSQPVIVGDS